MSESTLNRRQMLLGALAATAAAAVPGPQLPAADAARVFIWVDEPIRRVSHLDAMLKRLPPSSTRRTFRCLEDATDEELIEILRDAMRKEGIELRS